MIKNVYIKKIVAYLIATLIISSCTHDDNSTNSLTSNYRIRQEFYSWFNSSTYIWEQISDKTNEYDNLGRFIKKIDTNFQSSQYSKYIYASDDATFPLEKIEYNSSTKNDSDIENRKVFSYQNNRITELIEFRLNDATSILEEYKKIEYFYNDNNFLTKKNVYYIAEKLWNKTYEENWYYSGNKIFEFSLKLIANVGLGIDTKIQFIWEDNVVSEVKKAYWDYEQSIWVDHQTDKYFYNSENNLLQLIIYMHENNTIQQFREYNFSFQNNHLYEINTYHFDEDSLWALSGKTDFLYDSNWNNVSIINSAWYDSLYIPGMKNDFIYEYIYGNKEEIKKKLNPETYQIGFSFKIDGLFTYPAY